MRNTKYEKTLRESVREQVLSTNAPMTTRDIIIAIYGTYEGNEHKRRSVDRYIHELKLEGKISYIDGGARKVQTVPPKNPLEIHACSICGKDKVVYDLDEDCRCSYCRDLEEQTENKNTTHIESDYRKVGRLFGSYMSSEEKAAEEKRHAKLPAHVNILNTMIGTHIRAIVDSKKGRAVYGILRKVHHDGYVEVRRDDGAASLINTTTAVSIEPWAELDPLHRESTF